MADDSMTENSMIVDSTDDVVADVATEAVAEAVSEPVAVEVGDDDAEGAEGETAAEPATGPEPAVEAEPEPVVLSEDDVIADAPKPAREKSPYDRPGKWYVLHTQSGYEKKVKEKIEARAKSLNMEGKIHEIAIPMEEVTEVKANRKVVSKKKLFPGYLLIRCRLDDDSWYAIRNTEGVTGFVGAGNKPTPLTRRDVEGFITVDDGPTDEAPKRAKPRLEYELHETVQVKDGPFADFSGEIVEINEDHLKMKVLVNIFGRETPVELEFSQVGKL